MSQLFLVFVPETSVRLDPIVGPKQTNTLEEFQ